MPSKNITWAMGMIGIYKDNGVKELMCS
jgi:hypothetical protein